MIRFLATLGLIATMPVLAHAAPDARIAVPAGKMIPVQPVSRAQPADQIACAPDITKARACHQRQAELRREQRAVQSADASAKAANQAFD